MPKFSRAARVLVFGARGYSGLELVRLLLQHPAAKLVGCFATSSYDLRERLPEAGGLVAQPTERALDVARAENANWAFLATPFDASAALAPKLLEAGLNVIDLSGAFRLKSAEAFAKWYACPRHPALALALEAQYGLAPFAAGAAPALIANPGCYATAYGTGDDSSL